MSGVVAGGCVKCRLNAVKRHLTKGVRRLEKLAPRALCPRPIVGGEIEIIQSLPADTEVSGSLRHIVSVFLEAALNLGPLGCLCGLLPDLLETQALSRCGGLYSENAFG